jgi:hypothetical protein
MLKEKFNDKEAKNELWEFSRKNNRFIW